MRKPIIFGNWKMNLTLDNAVELAQGIRKNLKNVQGIDIGICPASPYLKDISRVLRNSNILLGAQNMHFEEKGAFTGEVSPLMLKDVGCSYVIIGHSERRHIFGEDNALINKKVQSAISHDLKPILCVGETLEQRKEKKTKDVIKNQLTEGLKDVHIENADDLVIAYEPVWAIGTGVTATSTQANDVHIFIRGLLAEVFGTDISQLIRIQYGGSVRPENVKELITETDIDGALVGGASLNAEPFTKIVQYKEV